MTGDELREEYAKREEWRRDALVMSAAFQLDLLHSKLQHADNMLRMAKEVGEAWRQLYQDSWRSLMRTWVNDKELFDEEMTRQAQRDERRELESRHTPFITEDEYVLTERRGQDAV